MVSFFDCSPSLPSAPFHEASTALQNYSPTSLNHQNTRTQNAWMQTREKQSPSPYCLEATNKKYRAHFHPLAELFSILQSTCPFDENILSIITQYTSEEFIHSIYAIAPELVNPQISLQHSLDAPLTNSHKSIGLSCKIKIAPEPGENGIIAFVYFERDLQENRWFALKQPKPLTPLEKFPLLEPQSSTCLQSYANNVLIASKIGGHPNFMKVFGLVLKTIKENARDFVPYLILEHIEGDDLKELTDNHRLLKEDLHEIFTQFANSMIFLFEQGISPQDVNARNLLFTPEKQLKFVDFDSWKLTTPRSIELAKELYAQTTGLATALASHHHQPGKNKQKPPPLNLDPEDVLQSFTNALNTLSSWFQN
jgi:hypothetical protein